MSKLITLKLNITINNIPESVLQDLEPLDLSNLPALDFLHPDTLFQSDTIDAVSSIMAALSAAGLYNADQFGSADEKMKWHKKFSEVMNKDI